MLPIIREELAWAAGFFDGEGSAYIVFVNSGHPNTTKPKKYPCFRVRVSQAGIHAIHLLNRFKRAVGGIGRVVGPYQPKRSIKHKLQWEYDASNFEHAQACIAFLWRWLGPAKKAQATKALANYHKNRNG